jgi:DNA-binding winged helix-turn-helix (wHTH) protein
MEGPHTFTGGGLMNADLGPAGDPVITFRFGELTFDCGSRLLTRRGVQQHLSPKAQRLLQILLLARPRALSREELYDTLWPSTFVCETNLAGVVGEIRRALGDDARAPHYIRTVHGFGYAFSGEAVPAPAMSEVAATLQCEQQSHPLVQGENSIGRSHDCRVVLTAPTVSRHHAVITIHDGAFSIQDLDSKNGTFLDGQLVGRQPVRVKQHVQIGFGALIASISFRKMLSTTSLHPNDERQRQVAEKRSTASVISRRR